VSGFKGLELPLESTTPRSIPVAFFFSASPNRPCYAPLPRGLSRSVGILSHAWEQTGQGGRNKGPIPREYLWAYEGPEPKAVP